MISRALIWMALALTLAACASKGTTANLPADAVREPPGGDARPSPGYDRGVKYLDMENYPSAADEFDRLLVAKPATELDLATTFNSGAAYEGMGQCDRAAERYREVARSATGKYPRMEAQALYRLSLAYECLNQNDKTVVSLLDARKRANELPMNVARAELPARLAAAYSRVGNRPMALKYFGEASQGLKDVLASGTSARAAKETVAKTLYAMGRLNAAQKRVEGDPLAFVQSLSMQQPYLLQAIELRFPQWTRRASEDLTLAYENLLRYSIGDPNRRRDYFVRVLQVINELRRIRMPDGGPAEDDVFATVDKVEHRARMNMSELGDATPLTPEAERRGGLKQSGRLVDPAPRRAK